MARYARRLNAVEINSSFYRPHRPTTYARWAASVPDDFRFSVKLPKAITHEARLVAAQTLIADFATSVGGLGSKLGAILVQLPPSLAFDAAVAGLFFHELHEATPVPIVCEPRHASWFTTEVDLHLAAWDVDRVAADPPVVPGGDQPGGRRAITYLRLHGAPRIYHSAYSASFVASLRATLAAAETPAWCIFDNTAAGAALGHALELTSGQVMPVGADAESRNR